jgi:hypothetical protein
MSFNAAFVQISCTFSEYILMLFFKNKLNILQNQILNVFNGKIMAPVPIYIFDFNL